jgi:hypothetical protein
MNPALPEFVGLEALAVPLVLSEGAVIGGAVVEGTEGGTLGVVPKVSVFVSVSVPMSVSVAVSVSVPVSVSVSVGLTPVDSTGGTCVRVGESESESDRDGSMEIGPGPVEGSPPGSESWAATNATAASATRIVNFILSYYRNTSKESEIREI